MIFYLFDLDVFDWLEMTSPIGIVCFDWPVISKPTAAFAGFDWSILSTSSITIVGIVPILKSSNKNN